MAGAGRRKCKCCHKLFRTDLRSRYRQRYCAAPRCRAASKAASQARWLAAPENRDYFRRPVNVARVGTNPLGESDAFRAEAWRQSWEVKVFGCIAMTRGFHNEMKKRRDGVIVS
jgi:NAD(P)-dependent dehydrogenase (short-subunit alcohol dehydrogenase family)